MKKLLFLLLLIPFLGNSQATFTAPVGYNTGAPTATPSGVGTRWRFDLLTGKKYTWLPGTLSWDEDARGIDQVAGCSAPLYTPGYNQSTFAVNACTVPELYQWTGAAWVLLNAGEVYTAGTGIFIDGSNVISNTSPNIVQTLSIAGQDLSLSGGGGTVEIPAGSSLGTGFVNGGGTGEIPAGTVAETGLSRFEYGYDSNPDAIAWIWNSGDDSNRIVNNSDGLDIASFDDFNGSSMRMVLSGGTGEFAAFNGTLSFTAKSNGTISFDQQECFLRFSSLDNNVIFEDTRAIQKGIEYAADYSATISANPQSLTDVQTVNSLKQKLATYTTAQRNAISSPATGYVIFCTDATATDSSTGVMQVYNGTTWKNAW